VIRTAVGPTVATMLIRRGYKMPMVNEFNYVKAGIVDSLGLLEFVLELEDAFSITLTDDEVATEEFQTIGGVVALIERKLQ
jgi:acyl carrier protein